MLMLRRMTLRRKTDPKTGKHTWHEPAQSKSTWTLHNSHFVWKFTRKCRTRLPRPVFCEPAESKCTWTCQKKHFVRKFTKKMPDASPMASVLCEPAQSKCTWTCCILCGNLQGKCRTLFPRPAFCASLRSRNAHGHVKRAIWHFVRKYRRKMPDAYLTASVLCEPAQSTMHMAHVRRAILSGNLQENAGRASRGQRFVRACAIEMHMDNVRRGILCGNLQGKCRTLISRPAFCASLRSRNAHGHVRRGILCGNLQGKCRTPRIPPQLN